LTSSTTATDIEQEKRSAAEHSLQFVRDGMCLGLGSGSTAAVMLELLGQRVRDGLRISGVPTSSSSERIAREAGIPLIGFDDVTALDLTIDGADEADRELNLIKGGGGALLREKIVASLSRHVVIIVDSRKRVDRLGEFALPVEVVQFAWRPIAKRLADLGAQVVLRADAAGQSYITDESNYILDCAFGCINDPPALARTLDAMPGVMEHGLFVNLAHTLVVGQESEVTVLNVTAE
jgi:ribose 5-phosphate isomerase A